MMRQELDAASVGAPKFVSTIHVPHSSLLPSPHLDPPSPPSTEGPTLRGTASLVLPVCIGLDKWQREQDVSAVEWNEERGHGRARNEWCGRRGAGAPAGRGGGRLARHEEHKHAGDRAGPPGTGAARPHQIGPTALASVSRPLPLARRRRDIRVSCPRPRVCAQPDMAQRSMGRMCFGVSLPGTGVPPSPPHLRCRFPAPRHMDACRTLVLIVPPPPRSAPLSQGTRSTCSRSAVPTARRGRSRGGTATSSTWTAS